MEIGTNLTTLLKDKEKNDYRVEHFQITALDKKGYRIALRDGIPPGKYVRLVHKNETLMSNTPMEIKSNTTFCERANGDVLIGGLGIGMIVLPIMEKENVRSITILEKNQEVIDIIAPQLNFNKKVHIIKADVFAWEPEDGTLYDCIYLDIWPHVNLDIYTNEMYPLKQRYRKYLKPSSQSLNRFIRCWAEKEARRQIVF